MPLKAGTYSLNTNSGKLNVYTFKEGFLSAIAHDLLIDVTSFTVNLNVPDAGPNSASVEAEIQSDSLKVICAMKDGERRPETLKDKDIADIEENINKDVLHPKKYPTINFRSTNIQEKEGSYNVNGELTLHGVTKPIEFDVKATNGGNLTGTLTLLQKDYKIKPFKAMLGTLKVKNEVKITFDLSLQQI